TGKRDKHLKVKRFSPLGLVIVALIIIMYFFTSSSSSVVNYIFSGISLKSTNGFVNILLLGIAGGTHDGAFLTDTILVASYNLKENKLKLISIPRDLWLPALKSKANAVYQLGLADNNGLGFSKTVMGNILGIPIHYGLRADFRGFVKAIDAIDGVDVLVDRSFEDYNYPIEGQENDLCGYEEKEMEFNQEEAKKLNIEPGKRKVFISPKGSIATDSAEEDKGVKYFSCRYEHISFEKGLMRMNGAIVLKYVRSRHGTNGEGSDFARSARQQKVIDAVRKKVLSFETLADPQKISDLVKTLGKSIDTDISVKDAIEFFKLSRKLKNSQSFVLDDRKSLLVHPNPSDYGGAFVLISEDDDFSIIHDYVRKILKEEITEYEATASARPGNK
ncbi:MAG: LCP family protein, partial [Candidatus Daviesbacteria bacterium]|nr:LCP family protein [Candidatus Daviesbacteria bacterium]